jgi:hypothetical protein
VLIHHWHWIWICVSSYGGVTRLTIFSFTSSHPILPRFSSETLVVFLHAFAYAVSQPFSGLAVSKLITSLHFSSQSFLSNLHPYNSAALALPAVPFSQYCLTLFESSLALPSLSTPAGGASLSDSFDLQLMQHRRLQVHQKLCHSILLI